MTCDHVQAVLAGEAPYVPVDEHLRTCEACRAFQASLDAVDALVPTLPAVPVPPDLVTATLAAMQREMIREQDGALGGGSERRSRWPWTLGTGLALAAAALLFLIPRGPGRGDLDEMIVRGPAGDEVPQLDWKLAVVRGAARAGGAEVERFHRERTYVAGDQLEFRIDADRPASVVVLRVGTGGVETFHHQAVGAGDVQLGAAWELEPEDDRATFVLLSSAQPPDEALLAEVEARLSEAYDAQDDTRICRVAIERGLGCMSAQVHVAPPGGEAP
jgi:hypothetical protein